MKRCETKRCRRTPKKGDKCETCKTREWRAANPMKAAFKNKRSNAKAKGHEFSISFAYFKQFCIETNYIAGAGRTATSFHIDRIIETIGYVEGNLQVLTNVENVKKYHEHRKRLLKYSKDLQGIPDHFWVEDGRTDVDRGDLPF